MAIFGGPVRPVPAGKQAPLIQGLSERVPATGGVLGFGGRRLTTRCAIAKPVEVRHSPATVTIAGTSFPMEVRTPTPQWLADLREKG